MSEETKEKIDNIRRYIEDLEKWVQTDVRWLLLRKWLIYVGFVPIGLILGYAIAYFRLIPIPISSYPTQSQTNDIAKSIIAPSITMNGLFIAFVPVIAFFFVAEIRDKQKSMEEDLLEERKQFSEAEDLKLFDSAFSLVNAFWHNFRVGVLNYTHAYLTFSMFSLFFLLLSYLGLDSGLFMLVDLILLVLVLGGVFPIVDAALSEPSLKLKTYVISGKIVRRIEY
jgi:hypothetical protein